MKTDIAELIRRIASLEKQLDNMKHHHPEVADTSGVLSQYLLLPGLRGLWAASQMNSAGQLLDVSGQDRTFGLYGNPKYSINNFAPVVIMDGNDCFFRSDDAALDISGTESYVISSPDRGGLTIGGWFWPTAGETNAVHMFSKYGTSGSYAYTLLYAANAGKKAHFYISGDGTTVDSAQSVSAMREEEWNFVVGRYDHANLDLNIFLNEEKTTADTTYTSIYNSSANIIIGGRDGPTSFFTGRASLCFICAMNVTDEIIHRLYESSRKLFKV